MEQLVMETASDSRLGLGYSLSQAAGRVHEQEVIGSWLGSSDEERDGITPTRRAGDQGNARPQASPSPTSPPPPPPLSRRQPVPNQSPSHIGWSSASAGHAMPATNSPSMSPPRLSASTSSQSPAIRSFQHSPAGDVNSPKTLFVHSTAPAAYMASPPRGQGAFTLDSDYARRSPIPHDSSESSLWKLQAARGKANKSPGLVEILESFNPATRPKDSERLRFSDEYRGLPNFALQEDSLRDVSEHLINDSRPDPFSRNALMSRGLRREHVQGGGFSREPMQDPCFDGILEGQSRRPAHHAKYSNTEMDLSNGIKHLSQLLLKKHGSEASLQVSNTPASPLQPSSDVHRPVLEASAHSCGVGMQTCKAHDGRVIVVYVHEGSPADIEGVRPGDEILYIESTSAQGMTQREVVEALSGPQGTSLFVVIMQNQVKHFRTLVRTDSVRSSESALNDMVTAIEMFKETDAQEQRRIEIQKHIDSLSTYLPSHVKVAERTSKTKVQPVPNSEPIESQTRSIHDDNKETPEPSTRHGTKCTTVKQQSPEICGVGMQLKKCKDGNIVIIHIKEGGPAARVGILQGDFLVSVDGVSIHGMDCHLIAQKIFGPIGSRVSLGEHTPSRLIPGPE
eukprot:108578-Hanusia_phi.AAC.2